MTEHLKVILGLDKANFTKGLKSIPGQLAKAAGAVGLALGAAKLFGDARAYADNILTLSDTIGVSTDFLQGWRAAAEESGVATNIADKGMQKLTLAMAEARKGTARFADTFAEVGVELTDTNGRAKTAEQVVYDLAGRFKDLADPVLKARAAYVLFGETGAQLTATLIQGSDALREQIESAKKLQREELAAVNRADKEIKKHQRNLTIYAGKAVESLSFAWKFWKKGFTEGGSMGEVARELMEVEREADKAAADREARLAEAKQLEEDLTKAAEELAAAEKKSAEEKQKALEREIELRKQVASATEAQGKAMGALITAHSDRTSMSLSDVANASVFNAEAARQRWAARSVLGLEDYARAARLHGRGDLAESALSRADSLRSTIGALSEAERNPMANLVQAVRDSDAKLAELVTLATGPGLNIQPKNGP